MIREIIRPLNVLTWNVQHPETKVVYIASEGYLKTELRKEGKAKHRASKKEELKILDNYNNEVKGTTEF